MVRKSRETSKECLCPLCRAPVKAVVDVDPAKSPRFYDDNAKKLYLWHTKREEKAKDIDKKELTPSDSLDDLELCEGRAANEVESKIKNTQSSIKPRVLDFSFEFSRPPNESHNSPSPENFKADSEMLDDKFLIRDSIVSPIARRQGMYMREVKMQSEEESLSENKVINLPKMFAVRGGIKRVKSLS